MLNGRRDTIGERKDLLKALDRDSMAFHNFITGLSESSGISFAEADYPRYFTLEASARNLSKV